MSSQAEQLRLAQLEKKRKEMMEEFERQKEDLSRGAERNRTGSDRFVGRVDSVEDHLKKSTIGLVNLEDFKHRRLMLEEAQAREAAKTAELKPEEKPKKKKPKKDRATKLSFAGEDEDEDEAEPSAKKKKLSKNPGVDTSFLPDRDREEQERREREELRQEWLRRQEQMKKEEIEITYSYWDGSGHRKSVKCKKGDTIAQFLEKCRLQFPELRGLHVDNLMYIKEDLIIPHHYTFYDFIVNRARGKSGPLFSFDVHDDVRLIADATVEKDESHAGKVVERGWYSKNKHIFPASRWEVYDPEKDYGAYSIKS